jgi:curved DNA-binding protein CbpA
LQHHPNKMGGPEESEPPAEKTFKLHNSLQHLFA